MQAWQIYLFVLWDVYVESRLCSVAKRVLAAWFFGFRYSFMDFRCKFEAQLIPGLQALMDAGHA